MLWSAGLKIVHANNFISTTKRLINDMSHNSLGPFELVQLRLVENLKEI